MPIKATEVIEKLNIEVRRLLKLKQFALVMKNGAVLAIIRPTLSVAIVFYLRPLSSASK
jgi:hypothetical protein